MTGQLFFIGYEEAYSDKFLFEAGPYLLREIAEKDCSTNYPGGGLRVVAVELKVITN